MNEINLTSVLERPLGEQHWPQLETIIKTLNDFIQQRVKNREYVEAQHAKEKIIQAQDEILRRNRTSGERREQKALDELMRNHGQERERLSKEWEVRFRKTELEFGELIDRKQQKQAMQKEKHRQQIELALPLQGSPDRELYHLRRQQENFVQCGDFLGAQRVKLQMAKREGELQEKHQKVRESNLRVMMGELEQRQAGELLGLEAKREQKLKEQYGQCKKREKELQDKQRREVKELKWIYAEEMKRFK